MALDRRKLLHASGGLAAAVAVVAPFAPSATASTNQTRPGGKPASPVSGADVAAANGWSIFAGRKVGVITNPTGVLANFRTIVDDMAAKGVEVGAVFGPEHGFRGGTAQDGASEGTSVDPRTGIPVYDSYGGATVADYVGFFEASGGVDTICFDIQDVGARFYTYIWTMWGGAMQAASRTGATFVVLDRPNPIGGQARGPVLQKGFESGVGQLGIALQHGMTVASSPNTSTQFTFRPPASSPSRTFRWWRSRDAPRHDGTGQPGGVDPAEPQHANTRNRHPVPRHGLVRGHQHVRRSRNHPAVRTHRRALRGLSLGGGLNSKGLAGVTFREAYFQPTLSKNQGLICGGVQVHITDAARVEALEVGTHMLVEAKRLYPGFGWRGDGGRWMGLLSGSARFAEQLDAGAGAKTIMDNWRSELDQFVRDTREYLLYNGKR